MTQKQINHVSHPPVTGWGSTLSCGALCLCLLTVMSGQPVQGALAMDKIPTAKGDLIIHPVEHASFVMRWNQLCIYVDPVGGANKYAEFPKADLVLLTHGHFDHTDIKTLPGIVGPKTVMLAPKVVTDILTPDLKEKSLILTNGQVKQILGLTVEAVPAYNLAAERQKFHPKGVGNGYVVTVGDKRIYISGDTEDIPEMRALKQIDAAFLCINLPYTMTVEQAADAVRQFRPRIVYPYHDRGSDLDKFKQLVGNDAGVEVRLLPWYK